MKSTRYLRSRREGGMSRRRRRRERKQLAPWMDE